MTRAQWYQCRGGAWASAGIAVLALAFATAPSRGAFISGLVDVKLDGSASGAGDTGTSGDVWNNEGSTNVTSPVNLNLVNGSASGATLTYSSLGNYAGGPNGPNSGLTGTYLYNGSTTPASGTATIGGLDSSGATTYNLYVYNGANAATRETVYTVTKGASTATDTVNDVTNTSAWVSNGNYYEFTALTPNSSGNIVVNFYGVSPDPSGKTEGDLAGFQLVGLAPEPASLSLLGGLSAFGLLARRRRVALVCV